MRLHSLPFTMEDVYPLIEAELPLRRTQGSTIYVDCPFCRNDGPGKGRGKLNINLNKDTYRCNRCGIGGGMLDLYSRVAGVPRDQTKSVIMQRLHLLSPQEKAEHKKVLTSIKTAPATIQAPRAAPFQIHRTLTLFLESLSLTDYHRNSLRERGLSDEQIDKLGYKSTPATGCNAIAAQLIKLDCSLEGVPGFFLNGEDKWDIHIPKHRSGIMTPARTEDGLTAGIMIRLDVPIKRTKCLWLSSTNDNRGTSSGSPIHCAGNPFSKAVYFTEGIMKADISHLYTDKTFYSVCGANQYARLPALFGKLKQHGVEDLVCAYDMDRYRNLAVLRGVNKFFDVAKEAGFAPEHLHLLEWNPKYKGIDDWETRRN